MRFSALAFLNRKPFGPNFVFVSLDNGGGSADQSVPTPASLDNGSSSVDQRIPTPVSHPSQSKNRVMEGAKDSMKDALVPKVVIDGNAGNIKSKSRASKGHDASKEGKTGSYDVTSSTKLSKGDAEKILQSLPAGTSARVPISLFCCHCFFRLLTLDC